MDLVCYKLASVGRPVSPLEETLAMFSALEVSARVPGAIHPLLKTLSSLFVLDPLPLVLGAIPVYVNTVPVRLVVLPLTVVHCATSVEILSDPVNLVILPTTFIAGAVGPRHDAVAAPHLTSPLTRICRTIFPTAHHVLIGTLGLPSARCGGRSSWHRHANVVVIRNRRAEYLRDLDPLLHCDVLLRLLATWAFGTARHRHGAHHGELLKPTQGMVLGGLALSRTVCHP
mmetsp:Transcript_31906/g.85344  ORF Transcript_31906/g.85344 Transcript_31906/m.85344 type:complete len:229 (+) Transcript_31906:636-1322(+)